MSTPMRTPAHKHCDTRTHCAEGISQSRKEMLGAPPGHWTDSLDWSSPLITPYVPPRGVLAPRRREGGVKLEGGGEGEKQDSQQRDNRGLRASHFVAAVLQADGQGSRSLRETEKGASESEIEGEEGGPHCHTTHRRLGFKIMRKEMYGTGSMCCRQARVRP
jgi:hypothetical protein